MEMKDEQARQQAQMDAHNDRMAEAIATPIANYPVDMSIKPEVQGFYDEATATISYIVKDPTSNAAAIIDSVMDIDYAAGRITFDHADMLIDEIRKQGLKLEWIIETHAHADHLSAAPYIQEKLGGKIGIGENIKIVQEVFGKIFNEGTEFQRDGSQFDALFTDGMTYKIGNMTAFAMHTPGHTPACMTHVIGDAAFVGDTLFMPDGGTARADFPGGDAGTLYDSIMKVLSLPDEMRLFMCHDYCPGGREPKWETTVAEEKANNIHIAGKTREEFIRVRTERDKTLKMPTLIIPSIQVNIRAGHIPEDKDGNQMLKVPVNKL
ncbi:Glyoxylase, beta-lactamase superfamily II [Meinhardsimonia xiamenensis]|uniref:Glyoxylase, beta-lactamase superfamily II n=1 Tax=Meinhardsimonia xiamenensis TaxID=990712 RepID=A0A1G9D3X4_9RHOB|nr:glyoxylase-like metal-dependent hydrolase (beta-lactamase superfamily II) [Meinhardsimonia xiamenensis]SDK58384.1 Glyoxylase, beta-lactamase superfamily II [Meinhardsimonia xiamenensis]